MEYVVGDTPLLQITITDADDGSAVDLTGTTVTLRFKVNGGTVETGGMTLTDATGGVCTRRWLTANLAASGTVLFEALVVNGSERYTTQEFKRNIRRAL
jgi:aspartyl aminopeptidase